MESDASEGLALLEDGKRGFADCRTSGVIRPLGRDELAIGAWQGGKEGRKTVRVMADL